MNFIGNSLGACTTVVSSGRLTNVRLFQYGVVHCLDSVGMMLVFLGVLWSRAAGNLRDLRIAPDIGLECTESAERYL